MLSAFIPEELAKPPYPDSERSVTTEQENFEAGIVKKFRPIHFPACLFDSTVQAGGGDR